MPSWALPIAFETRAASVTQALDQVDRFGKDAIRRADDSATLTGTRLYALLVASALETRLLKLIWEVRVREADRARVLGASSHCDRWIEAIRSGFMRHHGISPAQKLEHALDVTPRHRLSVLLSVIETDLKPLVELRNTLAHGQWYYAFNSAQSDLNPELMKALNNEHLRGLQHKREIAAAFAHCVQDLLVSDTTFERDFDTHFHRVPCSCDWARRRRASLRRLT